MDKSFAEYILKSAELSVKEKASKIHSQKGVFIFSKSPLKAVVYDFSEKNTYWVEEIYPNRLLCSCRKGFQICSHKVAVSYSVKLDAKVIDFKTDCEKFLYLSQAFYPQTSILTSFVKDDFYLLRKSVYQNFKSFEGLKTLRDRFLLSLILALLEIFKPKNAEVYRTLLQAITENCKKFNTVEDPLVEILLAKVLLNLKRLIDFGEFLSLLRENLKKFHCKGMLMELLTFRVMSGIVETEKEAKEILKTFEDFEFQKELRLFLTRKGVLKNNRLEWNCEFKLLNFITGCEVVKSKK